MTAITETAPNANIQRPSVHPLVHAGKGLLSDLLSTFVFVGLFALTHDVFKATGLAIGAGVLQIAYFKLRRQPIDLMQWMSLALVLVFGGASLLTHDPRFIMIKFSLIKCAIGAVMLRRGWMTRYVPPESVRWSGDVIVAFGYVWAGLMFLMAALNVILVYTVDTATWAWFVGFFPLASMLGLFAIQYLTSHAIVARRMRAAGVAR